MWSCTMYVHLKNGTASLDMCVFKLVGTHGITLQLLSLDSEKGIRQDTVYRDKTKLVLKKILREKQHLISIFIISEQNIL